MTLLCDPCPTQGLGFLRKARPTLALSLQACCSVPSAWNTLPTTETLENWPLAYLQHSKCPFSSNNEHEEKAQSALTPP